MSRRRWPGRDRGAFTAELAAGLPALMLLLLAGLTAVSAVTAQARCEDAAREAALATARGADGPGRGTQVAPPGAVVEVEAGDDAVTARVRARVRLLGAQLPVITVEGAAVAAREPDVVGTAG